MRRGITERRGQPWHGANKIDDRDQRWAALAAVSWLQLPALNPGPAVDATGESHYQDALESVAGGRTCFGVNTPLITAVLVREPTNLYDPNKEAERQM